MGDLIRTRGVVSPGLMRGFVTVPEPSSHRSVAAGRSRVGVGVGGGAGTAEDVGLSQTLRELHLKIPQQIPTRAF